MRPVTAILIAVALLGGGGAAFMGKKVIEWRAAQAVAEQEEARRDIGVLVAARDLSQGAILRESDLRWDMWPVPTARATGVVTAQADKPILAHLPGRALVRSVVAGEPVRADSVFVPGKGSLMPGVLEAGMRAVGIKVTAASAASGFVLPGDRVDVVMVADLSRRGGALPGGGRFAAETILADVRVVGVDQALSSENVPKGRRTKKNKDKEADAASDEPDTVAVVSKTVAIEVTPAQAEAVLIAQEVGELSLVLRSQAAGDAIERPAPYLTDVTTSRALKQAQGGSGRVIRGGN